MASLRADKHLHPFTHLPRRLVREGDREDLVRPRATRIEQVGDPVRQYASLA